ncbi:MAG: acyltransferase family protein [Actinobacteria bacterium]|nr:acyltransferase family protein [Actinomycetota bacterium]MDA2982181.1 acyltransferase family protein [Actinomycetota bacterium]MDA2996980.1 acyltransferase family protein [Actinomycetota bacterium]
MQRASISSTHIPAIDGLRALAVFAVVLYHLGISWMPGGFLGVDLFFVISGYVITRLILDSIESANGLDLKKFYAARIRRLFPGLIALLIATTVMIALFAPDAIRRFIKDVPYVLSGTNNWHLVALEQDYFQAIGRPPLLQHTWSLAVEFQFYLIWPIILLFVWRKFGKRVVRRAALIIATFSGTALFLFSLQADNATAGRISHIYFGTDTHSLGLFLGSALAVSWIPRNLTRNISQRAQDFIDGIGVFGFIGLLCIFLFIDQENTTLYQIAFPLAALFGCATMVSIVHPASRFSPLLSNRVLLWIGQRSYGIYLWHWVVFQVTRPGADLTGNLLALNVARVLVVLALADISLRAIEIPIRNGVVQNWFRGIKYRTKVMQKRQRIFVASVTAFIVVISGSSVAVAWQRDQSIIVEIKPELDLPDAAVSSSGSGLWVTGDSVILGIRNKLAAQEEIALINARVGRQIQELIKEVETDKPRVGESKVVLNVGNNNSVSREDMVKLLELLKDQPRVVVVNTAVPRTWRDGNNKIISEVVSSYPNAVLVDWASIAENHPEFFAPDGVHLIEAGSDVYVASILEALNLN